MDELEARIEALERAVTEGEHDLSELATAGETRERVAAVEADVDDLADRVAQLEAATQALRGYVGNVRAVNNDIERRADAALAKAESLESALVGEPSRNGPPDAGEGPPDSDGPARPADGHPRTDSGGRTRQGVGSTDGDGEHGRCEACGRRTDGTDAGVGSGFGAEGGHDTGTGEDPLGSMFEAGGTEDDVGTFDRIRRML